MLLFYLFRHLCDRYFLFIIRLNTHTLSNDRLIWMSRSRQIYVCWPIRIVLCSSFLFRVCVCVCAIFEYIIRIGWLKSRSLSCCRNFNRTLMKDFALVFFSLISFRYLLRIPSDRLEFHEFFFLLSFTHRECDKTQTLEPVSLYNVRQIVTWW